MPICGVCSLNLLNQVNKYVSFCSHSQKLIHLG